MLPDLLANKDKYALIRSESLIGIYDTEREAMKAGYALRPRGGFFVHKIGEPKLEFICPSRFFYDISYNNSSTDQT